MTADIDGNGLFELLYVSLATQQFSNEDVRALAKIASRKNAKLGITGLLVFDGERFCQHLEGEPNSIRDMFEDILRDSRHREIRVLISGESSRRKFRLFGMGFAAIGDIGLLKELVILEGDRAMRAFAGIVPISQIE